MTDKQMDDLAVRVATKVIKAIFNISSEVHLVFENQNDHLWKLLQSCWCEFTVNDLGKARDAFSRRT